MSLIFRRLVRPDKRESLQVTTRKCVAGSIRFLGNGTIHYLNHGVARPYEYKTSCVVIGWCNTLDVASTPSSIGNGSGCFHLLRVEWDFFSKNGDGQ